MSILDPFKTPNIDVEIEIVKSEPYFKVKAKAVLQDLTFFKIDGQFTETSASV